DHTYTSREKRLHAHSQVSNLYNHTAKTNRDHNNRETTSCRSHVAFIFQRRDVIGGGGTRLTMIDSGDSEWNDEWLSCSITEGE
ncbi:hypothetical protein ANANG_G00100500, partial [Anguilla anguilla]